MARGNITRKGCPSRRRNTFTLFVLCLTTICTMSDFVITPIAADLYDAFSEYPEYMVNLGITGPALAGMPFLVLSGWLCDHLDKRTVMIAGFALFTAASTFGASADYWPWLICRLLVGIGWGITSTTAFSIMSSLYKNEADRNKAIGVYDASLSIMGASLAFAAGLLAQGAWQQAYRAYLISIPVLFLLLSLPSMPPRTDQKQRALTEKHSVSPIRKQKGLIALLIRIFVVGSCYYQTVYTLALFVQSSQLGGEALTGFLSAVSTLSGAVGALSYGFLANRMKHAVYVPFLAAMGISFVLMAIFPQPAVATISMAVVGFCWQIFYCFFYARSSSLEIGARQGVAIGLAGLANSLAASFSPFLFIFVNEILGSYLGLNAWLLFAVPLFCVAFFDGTFALRRRSLDLDDVVYAES